MEQPVSTAAVQARRLEAVYAAIAAAFEEPGVLERLRSAPADEWSTMQILGHMVEMIPYWLSHCQAMIAAQDGPVKVGRALDASERLAGVERGAAATPEGLLQALGQAVTRGSAAIQAMTPAEREQRGEHVRLGAVTVAQLIEMTIITHAEDHLAQIRQTLQHSTNQ